MGRVRQGHHNLLRCRHSATRGQTVTGKAKCPHKRASGQGRKKEVVHGRKDSRHLAGMENSNMSIHRLGRVDYKALKASFRGGIMSCLSASFLHPNKTSSLFSIWELWQFGAVSSFLAPSGVQQ